LLQEVGQKICRTYANGTKICIGNLEQCFAGSVTEIRTVTSTIDPTTAVVGLVKVMIETWHITITAKDTTFSLSTHMVISYNFDMERIYAAASCYYHSRQNSHSHKASGIQYIQIEHKCRHAASTRIPE
jgi:hypothetical protein